jgi:hypothetical protein
MDKEGTMEITLTRTQKGSYGTFGKIDDAIFKSNTMEPGNTGEHPCIPVGKYRCTLGISPHFYENHADYGFGRGVVYHVLNVPGRDHILIHPANMPSQLQGCIALGSGIPGKEGYTGILASIPAVKAFMSAMKGEDFILNIVEG